MTPRPHDAPRRARAVRTALVCLLVLPVGTLGMHAAGAEEAAPKTESVSSPSADLEAIELAEQTTENLPLVTTGEVEGSDIVWESTDPELVSGTDPGHVAPEIGMDDPSAGGGVATRPACRAGRPGGTRTRPA